MKYPGRIIKSGETDAGVVRALKQRLNQVVAEAKLDTNDSNFGHKTTEAVELFQGRHVDQRGNPLHVDGQVGPLTWAALFGEAALPSSDSSADPLLARVLQVAAGEEAKHVRETPSGSNRGPEVNVYLKTAGAEPGEPWCCSFVYWCFEKASQSLGKANPMVKTAGCLDHWERAGLKGAKRIPASQALHAPGLVRPGMIFVNNHGGGKGHTGLVEKVSGGFITTIEGNTNASQGREGDGVYRLNRKIRDITQGFIDYAGIAVT